MPLVVDPTGNDLTYKIIGAAMAVHNSLGYGYKEEVYEKALYAELEKQNIPVQRQVPVDVWHADVQVGLFILDLLVDGQVVVEVKALSHQLTGDEVAQVVNYLKATERQVGLLINFGRRRLEYKRIFPPNSKGPVQRIGRDNVARSNYLDREPETGDQ
jgi:GxxExxY protein